MNVEGMFKHWIFGEHYITHSDKEHCIKIYCGFSDFKDDSLAKKYVLAGLKKNERKLIWNEYQRELRSRSLKNVGGLLNEK